MVVCPFHFFSQLSPFSHRDLKSSLFLQGFASTVQALHIITLRPINGFDNIERCFGGGIYSIKKTIPCAPERYKKKEIILQNKKWLSPAILG